MIAALVAPVILRLWAGDAPGALGKRDQDIPTLSVFEPAHPGDTAIVVCPGGGYGMLADHEGTTYAQYLNTLGVTAYVLKYRLGSNGYRDPIIGGDALRAIRLVRSFNKFKFIGIMGSSAGGHLTATALTRGDDGNASATDPVDRESSRASFGVLCYAVITMRDFGHAGSKANLLGDHPTEAQIHANSNEEQVTAKTPPCFIWHTVEDQAVPVENSIRFAQALGKAGVPYELHLYEKGQHGIGLADQPPFAHLHPWGIELARWLKERGYTK